MNILGTSNFDIAVDLFSILSENYILQIILTTVYNFLVDRHLMLNDNIKKLAYFCKHNNDVKLISM